MIRHWATIEADFEREYGINLGSDVWGMSWRRFVVLLRGLSGRSGWATLARIATKDGTRKTIRGADVDAYFDGLGA